MAVANIVDGFPHDSDFIPNWGQKETQHLIKIKSHSRNCTDVI